MGIKAVLFDLGGTLIHFEGPWNEVMSSANQELVKYLKDEGLNLHEKQFLATLERRLGEYYAQREAEFIEYTTANVLRDLLLELGFKNITQDFLRPALNRLYAVSQAHWKREDDAVSTLSQLRDRGLRMAIISNASDDADVQTLVDNAGLRDFFEVILSSAHAGIRKPNPVIFQKALSSLEISAAEAAMVGDTLGADILGARNAGIYSIWITRRADTPGNRDHLDTILPDAEIARLSELPSLLENLEHQGTKTIAKK